MDLSRIAQNLTRGSDGIWFSKTAEQVSYPSDGNQNCLEIETSSFWFNHRNRCIMAAVQALPPPPSGPFFDIGGGNGYVSLSLMKAGHEVVLVEPGPDGARNAYRRGISTVARTTHTSAGFIPGCAAAVGLFDVVEHTVDDVDFIKSVRPLLRQGGRLYITVPAYNWLWSQEDVEAGHFRRYTLGPIRQALHLAGFNVDYASYIFRPLPLPILLARRLPYLVGWNRSGRNPAASAGDHAPTTSLAGRMLQSLLESEPVNIRAGKVMKFGGSCLVVATVS